MLFQAHLYGQTWLVDILEKGKLFVNRNSTKTQVENDDLGDWRIQAATRLAADLPSAYPGGPSHKAGSPLYQTTRTETPVHPNLHFITPNATALAIDAAIRSAERAAALWAKIAFAEVVTPQGRGTSAQDVSGLFDYFQETMACSNTSFQAIEAFANEMIGRYFKKPIILKRAKGPETFDSDQLQRHVSTEEKIATVLPLLLNKPSLKGRVEWQHFKELKEVRDAAVHFKSDDQYPPNGTTDKESLHYLLLTREPNRYPEAASRMIWALRVETETPRWLTHLAEKYGLRT
jgi:hypothetical protein